MPPPINKENTSLNKQINKKTNTFKNKKQDHTYIN